MGEKTRSVEEAKLCKEDVLPSISKKVSRAKLVTIAGVVVACAFLLFSLSGCVQTEGQAPQLKEAELTKPTISEDGVLKVGVNTSNSPMAGNSGDKIIGIDVDIAAAVADELGLSLEITDVSSNGVKAITDGDVDVVFGIESDADVEGCWLSSQYLQTGVALFGKASSNKTPPSAGDSTEIAAQVSSKSAWAVTNIFGEDSLATATDLSAAFSNMESGEVEYVASDAIVGLYASNRQSGDAKICALLESPSGYCVMVSESNTELQQAIAGALTTIKENGIISIIEDKWLGCEVDLSGISKIEGSPVQTTNATNSDNDEASEDAANTDTSNEANTSSKSSSSSSSSSSKSSSSSSKSSSSASSSTA